MKLRIRGDSIRLRLTQSEVATLQSKGEIEEISEFSSVCHFAYSLVVVDSDEILAKFHESKITISLPKSFAETWINSDETGIYGSYGKLEIAVEKDFKCLIPRNHDDFDAFPNPKEDQ
jgi:hypothetical protein